MNTTNNLSFTNPCLETNPPGEIWQLDEPTLFPIHIGEWENQLQLPAHDSPHVLARHALDLFPNQRARPSVLAFVRRLLTTSRPKFAASRAILSPIQWRHLYYIDMYPFSTLSRDDFDGGDAFQQIMHQDPWATEVPSIWTGSTSTSCKVMREIHARLGNASLDQLKHVYATLTFARCIAFEKNDILQVPWWECWWIDGYLNAASQSG